MEEPALEQGCHLLLHLQLNLLLELLGPLPLLLEYQRLLLLLGYGLLDLSLYVAHDSRLLLADLLQQLRLELLYQDLVRFNSLPHVLRLELSFLLGFLEELLYLFELRCFPKLAQLLMKLEKVTVESVDYLLAQRVHELFLVEATTPDVAKQRLVLLRAQLGLVVVPMTLLVVVDQEGVARKELETQHAPEHLRVSLR